MEATLVRSSDTQRKRENFGTTFRFKHRAPCRKELLQADVLIFN